MLIKLFTSGLAGEGGAGARVGVSLRPAVQLLHAGESGRALLSGRRRLVVLPRSSFRMRTFSSHSRTPALAHRYLDTQTNSQLWRLSLLLQPVPPVPAQPPSPPLPPAAAPALPTSSAQGDLSNLDQDLLTERSLREGWGATGREGKWEEGGMEGGQEGRGGQVERQADRLAETRSQGARHRELKSREEEGGGQREYVERGRIQSDIGGLPPSVHGTDVGGAQSAEKVRLRDLGPAQAHLYLPPPLPLPPVRPRTLHTSSYAHPGPWGSGPGLTDDEDDDERFGVA